MITQGNTKLGPAIWGWSIPAEKTCPGASAACLEVCYGLTGRFLMPNVKAAHKQNYKISKTDHFTSWMTGMIKDFWVQVLRIHVVGDFYDEAYIAKWHNIVKANPRTKFFAFTRSWTEVELYEPLLALANERNVRMWWSWDVSMPVPPNDRGVRRCYLSGNDFDQPPAKKADLIFRDDQSTVLKVIDDGTLVCCYDNGVDYAKGQMTCSKCGICWKNKKAPKRKRYARKDDNNDNAHADTARSGH